jgi:hypothetical protein
VIANSQDYLETKDISQSSQRYNKSDMLAHKMHPLSIIKLSLECMYDTSSQKNRLKFACGRKIICQHAINLFFHILANFHFHQMKDLVPFPRVAYILHDEFDASLMFDKE